MVIVGYYEDGSNLVTMAMNDWGTAEPAWWLNMQTRPEAVVELAGGNRREVIGRAAIGEERDRLWKALARDRQESRRPRCATPSGDGGHRPRAAGGITGPDKTAAPTLLDTTSSIWMVDLDGRSG
jgi:hypothetical protein